MKKKLMEDALNRIRDDYIAEAAGYKKRRVLPWIGSVAAALALVIGLQFLQVPVAIQAEAVVLAEAPRVESQPQPEDYPDISAWRAEHDQWLRQRQLLLETTQTAAEQMEPFVFESMQTFLCGTSENRLYSPVNAYLGLAMTAELTGGETQQQLLAALGADSPEDLRGHASALWESIYMQTGVEVSYVQSTANGTSQTGGSAVISVKENHEVSVLANSLWLDETLDYNHRPMSALARYYYTSVYQQDLSDPQAAKDIQTWLNQNTGGLLEVSTEDLQLPEEALMSLYSTIYFRSRWTEEFSADSNTHNIFHGTSGDTVATFMNKQLYQTNYYFARDFGAVMLPLKNGSQMWFFLPDEGKTVDDILDDHQYLDMLTAGEDRWGSQKYMLVNLSVPKFDIQATTDLRSGLEAMGITHLFDPVRADFSVSLNTPAYMASANQNIRVAVDESGVTAAAYIELPTPGSAQPPRESIDFILDRPFLFVIVKDQIPLFAGVINGL